MLAFGSDFLGVGEHTYSKLYLHMLHICVKRLLCTMQHEKQIKAEKALNLMKLIFC